jgi:ribosomal protein S18 acetylase RimI-like enzyme
VSSEAGLTAVYPLMRQLRDRITPETFAAEVRVQQAQGYELIAGFDAGTPVVLAGIRRTHTLSRGAHLFVDDLVTSDAVRGRGHGRAMLAHLAALARAAGLPRVYLDARLTAKGFYEQLGFTFLTSVPCWIEADRL